MYSFKELDTVINHFKMYPLLTNKCSDFKLFIMIYEIMRRKERLTQEELIKIIAIKASLNRGLSEKLKLAKAPPPNTPFSPLLKIRRGEKGEGVLRRGGFWLILTKSFLLKKNNFAKISLS